MRLLFIAAMLTLVSTQAGQALADGKWQGVDETVIEKYAGERGMQKKCFIDLEGDTQLLAFLAAGAAGGFAAGYFFRDLKSKKRK